MTHQNTPPMSTASIFNAWCQSGKLAPEAAASGSDMDNFVAGKLREVELETSPEKAFADLALVVWFENDLLAASPQLKDRNRLMGHIDRHKQATRAVSSRWRYAVGAGVGVTIAVFPILSVSLVFAVTVPGAPSEAASMVADADAASEKLDRILLEDGLARARMTPARAHEDLHRRVREYHDLTRDVALARNRTWTVGYSIGINSGLGVTFGVTFTTPVG